MSSNEITDVTHWDSAWAQRPRLRFPSKLNIGTRNVLRLLQRYLCPSTRYVELGCAPGKTLAWVARATQTSVCGVDYSPRGVDTARWLCSGLGVQADIRCEDIMSTSFEDSSFDLAFSCGLVEHFEDPKPMIMAHVRLLAPGGTAVIAVPNYTGIYLKLQAWCDPDNLAIHNLAIMSEQALLGHAPKASNLTTKSFRFGSISPWLVSLPSKFGAVGNAISWGINFGAQIQPLDINELCPLIVLEVNRAME